ncbi:MAG: hypothetical protein U1E76_03685 [Planctomycetota bacterium]
MRGAGTSRQEAYHFIVLPNTGIQICRGFPLQPDPGLSADELWQLAQRRAQAFAREEVIRIVSAHIACNQELEATGWIKCDLNEFVFFRLTRTGAELQLDLVIDTENGAGKQEKNRIDCVLESGVPLLRKRHTLASFYVESFREARNEIGSLIFDFGNSSSSFVFSREGGGAIQARVVQPNNPFDPRYRERVPGERNLLKSNMIVLRTGTSLDKEPWIVLGDRSEELIQVHPLASYLYAPKKYVRHWPPQLKSAEPTMKFRGIMGQREGLHPTLDFVRYTIEQMMQYVIASLTNPHFTSDEPAFYPQFSRILLTYPLTWRKVDRELFQRLVEEVAARQLSMQKEVAKTFRVELACSEPVAVAAYVLWETFFHFGSKNLALAASTLGNPSGTAELRVLVVDIGGGSTDIAMIDVGWSPRREEDSVDVTFKMLESMRFNRAGDRLSHLIATALVEFLRDKYGLDESLDFRIEAKNAAFTRAYKRQAVSKLSELAEACKAALSAAPQAAWTLAPREELELLRCFEPLLTAPPANGNGAARPDLEERVKAAPRLEIPLAVLAQWVQSDRQSMETNGEPGFMDILLYLKELRFSLEQRDRAPHLVILSGRSTRLPFLKGLVAEHLKLPWHRIRSVAELLPDSLKTQGHENMDKLAVACGAQRFRFGDHIRFVTLPEDPVFNRFIGTLRETPGGLKLNRVFLEPGEAKPRTVKLALEPSQTVRIGHAFRAEGAAQVIAEVTNLSTDQRHEVELNLQDDYSATMAPHEAVTLWEWVPGGNDLIVDNFNDTGCIDGEPPGLLGRIVARNKSQWLGRK